MKTLTTILHATDFSDLAANAFHAAYALARAHSARLILLFVVQPEEYCQGEFGLTPPEPEPTDEVILEQMKQMIPAESPVQVERLVEHGIPAEVIVQVAKEMHCDLIVLGTHGRKGLARLFYGNVADSVTRAAHCPVLALRSSKTEAEESGVDAETRQPQEV